MYKHFNVACKRAFHHLTKQKNLNRNLSKYDLYDIDIDQAAASIEYEEKQFLQQNQMKRALLNLFERHDQPIIA